MDCLGALEIFRRERFLEDNALPKFWTFSSTWAKKESK